MSLKSYFLPYAINEWNKLDPTIRKVEKFSSFEKMLLTFKRSTGKSTYEIYDPLGIQLFTALWLGKKGNKKFNSNMNVSILTATISFIKECQRFYEPFLTIMKVILISSSICIL